MLSAKRGERFNVYVHKIYAKKSLSRWNKIFIFADEDHNLSS